MTRPPAPASGEAVPAERSPSSAPEAFRAAYPAGDAATPPRNSAGGLHPQGGPCESGTASGIGVPVPPAGFLGSAAEAMSPTEIAAALGISVARVRQLLERALRRFARAAVAAGLLERAPTAGELRAAAWASRPVPSEPYREPSEDHAHDRTTGQRSFFAGSAVEACAFVWGLYRDACPVLPEPVSCAEPEPFASGDGTSGRHAHGGSACACASASSSSAGIAAPDPCNAPDLRPKGTREC